MIGQALILRTKWTAPRILVIFVVFGALLAAAQVFTIIRDTVGAGITVPITGFGGIMAEGAMNSVRENGFLGIFLGPLTAAAAGIAAATVFALIVSLIAKSRSKK